MDINVCTEYWEGLLGKLEKVSEVKWKGHDRNSPTECPPDQYLFYRTCNQSLTRSDTKPLSSSLFPADEVSNEEFINICKQQHPRKESIYFNIEELKSLILKIKDTIKIIGLN